MDQPAERWKALCEQAATEQDGDRLLEIINELNEVLEERATGRDVLQPCSLTAFPDHVPDDIL